MDSKMIKPEESQTHGAHTFEQLMNGLKNAVNEFQEDASPEKFAKIITVLGAFGISGADVWNKASQFLKKHPVQSAAAAGLIFFALRGLAVTGGRRSTKRGSIYH